MEEPKVNEIFADNGEHSHWQLIDANGKILWSEEPIEVKAKKERVMRYFTSCPSCESTEIYFEGHWTCKNCTHDWGGR